MENTHKSRTCETNKNICSPEISGTKVPLIHSVIGVTNIILISFVILSLLNQKYFLVTENIVVADKRINLNNSSIYIRFH